jgi:hypothetical protein
LVIDDSVDEASTGPEFDSLNQAVAYRNGQALKLLRLREGTRRGESNTVTGRGSLGDPNGERAPLRDLSRRSKVRQQNGLLDHLISAGEQGGRHVKAERYPSPALGMPEDTLSPNIPQLVSTDSGTVPSIE